MRPIALLSLASIALAGCTHVQTPPEPVFLETPERCETSVFAVDAQFSSANMASCSIAADRTIEVKLVPEDVPINASPWYAVRVTPTVSGPVRLVLNYDEHPHRYKPKVSMDGESWTVLPEDRVETSAGGFRVVLDLDLDDTPLFVSAQELFTNAAKDAWIERAAETEGVALTQIGISIEGRPIKMLATQASTASAKTVMIAGRQHPPEIPGALGAAVFLDELLSDTELARTFRDTFNLVMVPHMNPDGVEHGYWRHNMGGLDLNRDWGPFTQPETQAVKAVIDEIESDPEQELAVFLDFHSTRYNVFYTQPVGEDGTDYGFTATWLERSGARLPDYEFGRQGNHRPEFPTSKNYIHERFGIPAITYEIGDETDRTQIDVSAKVFAQELMKLLLEKEAG